MATKPVYQDMTAWAYAREKDRMPEEFEKGMQQIKTSTPLFGYLPPRWMLDKGSTGEPQRAAGCFAQ